MEKLRDVRDYYKKNLEVRNFGEVTRFLNITSSLVDVQSEAVEYVIRTTGMRIGSYRIVDSVILPGVYLETLSDLVAATAKTISLFVNDYDFINDPNLGGKISDTEILVIPIKDPYETDVILLRNRLIRSGFFTQTKPLCKILIVSKTELAHCAIAQPLNNILRSFY